MFNQLHTWREVFLDIKHTLNFITEGVNKGEIYMALDSSGDLIGFMRIDLFGAFAKFPLLRVIAVKERLRAKGYGSAMLKFYEDLGFENSDKVFLLVSEFNERAKLLYERIGYIEVGKIPDLYQNGIAEHLMIKKVGNLAFYKLRDSGEFTGIPYLFLGVKQDFVRFF